MENLNKIVKDKSKKKEKIDFKDEITSLLSIDEIENLTKTSFSQHFIELRKRIFISVITFFITTSISFYFAEEIYAFLLKPLVKALKNDSRHHLIYTGLVEVFFTHMRLSLFTGFILSFPIIAYQFYFFIAPGLYKPEKNAIKPYLLCAPILFLIGVLVAYYLVIPIAWKFFLSFETNGTKELPIIFEPKVNEYLDIVIELSISFGLAFQLPLIILILNKLKILTMNLLVNLRKYVVVVIFIIAAILTPPDVISQIMLAIPMLLLYEISVFICYRIEKKNLQKANKCKT